MVIVAGLVGFIAGAIVGFIMAALLGANARHFGRHEGYEEGWRDRSRPGEGVVSTYTDGGMSLRDWFAGQALMGFRADHCGFSSEEVAGFAYRDADAMLAKRDRQP